MMPHIRLVASTNSVIFASLRRSVHRSSADEALKQRLADPVLFPMERGVAKCYPSCLLLLYPVVIAFDRKAIPCRPAHSRSSPAGLEKTISTS